MWTILGTGCFAHVYIARLGQHFHVHRSGFSRKGWIHVILTITSSCTKLCTFSRPVFACKIKTSIRYYLGTVEGLSCIRPRHLSWLPFEANTRYSTMDLTHSVHMRCPSVATQQFTTFIRLKDSVGLTRVTEVTT